MSSGAVIDAILTAIVAIPIELAFDPIIFSLSSNPMFPWLGEMLVLLADASLLATLFVLFDKALGL